MYYNCKTREAAIQEVNRFFDKANWSNPAYLEEDLKAIRDLMLRMITKINDYTPGMWKLRGDWHLPVYTTAPPHDVGANINCRVSFDPFHDKASTEQS